MKRVVILMIIDGWGIGRPDQTNPQHQAKLPNIDYIKRHFPAGALQASGIAVGLPWDEEGNSEVGHLTIGAGRILYQHFPRISLSIRDGSFFQNPALKKAFEHAKSNQSAVNLAGLLTEGNVHASLEHLEALLRFAAKEGVKNVNIHLFTDGKDSPPKSALKLLKNLQETISKTGVGAIASISGRYYAMERDQHWDRTELAYKVLTGQDHVVPDAESTLKKLEERNFNEEFLEPVLVGDENHGIKDNDALIFFNFREDSMRQITETFLNPAFDKFSVKKFNNLYVAAMTRYQDKFPAAVAFPPEKSEMPLGKVLEENGRLQMRIAETEKYAHITYFFNGLREKPFEDEYRVLIPSLNVARHEQFPKMMASAITDRVISSLTENAFDFILINYANADIIAHTGNFEATMEAVETIDEQVGMILKAVLDQNHILLITSDHGNSERLLDPLTAMPETKHDPSPVPIYLIAKELQKNKSEFVIRLAEAEVIGLLSDVAPTVLEIMGLPKPEEMTGQSLIQLLK